ncbi:unnamed protein product, partial [marine sediment metagenome]
MGKLALKYGSFFNIIVMEAWFFSIYYNEGTIPWEPAILFITSLATFLYLEIIEQMKVDPTDCQLFHEFLTVLPYERSITYIDCHDISAGPFDPENHEDLRNFYNHWDCASHEFNHKGIEIRKKALWELIESYIVDLDTYTVPTDDNKRVLSPELKEKDSDEWREIINNIHCQAGLIVITHQDFV